jgi:hypothetical protein
MVEDASDNVDVGQYFALRAFILVPQVRKEVSYCRRSDTGSFLVVCDTLLFAQTNVASQNFGLECEVSLRVDGPRMRALVEPGKLGEQSQCRRYNVLLVRRSGSATDKPTCNRWLQYGLDQESAIFGEFAVAGEHLEQERKHSRYLRKNSFEVGLGGKIPCLDDVL